MERETIANVSLGVSVLAGLSASYATKEIMTSLIPSDGMNKVQLAITGVGVALIAGAVTTAIVKETNDTIMMLADEFLAAEEEFQEFKEEKEVE